MGATDAATELIELRQAESVGAIDEHGVRVRDVEARLYDHGGDEYVDFAIDELAHDLLELALPHLAVSHANARARNNVADVLGHPVDRLDPVVDEEHLPAAIQLPGNPLVDLPIVPWLDVGEHG